MKVISIAAVVLGVISQASAFTTCSPAEDRKHATGPIQCVRVQDASLTGTDFFQGAFNLKDTDIDFLIGKIEGNCPKSGGLWNPKATITAEGGSYHDIELVFRVWKDDRIGRYRQEVMRLGEVGAVSLVPTSATDFTDFPIGKRLRSSVSPRVLELEKACQN